MRQHAPRVWLDLSGGSCGGRCRTDLASSYLPRKLCDFFGEKLKISRTAAVPWYQRCTRLVLNLSVPPDKEIPSVNDTMDREIAPESAQFGKTFPRTLQAIWEADPEEGLVRV